MEKITKSSDSILIDPNEPLILPDGTALVGRVEWFLYALCCLDYQNLPTPMSRIEEFANALITGEIPNIEPQSRAEKFFLAILDGNVSDLPRPQSRSEVLLDKLARGEFDLSDVEPIQSRYELLLAYLIKNGGIGNIDYVLYEFSEEMKTMYNTVEKPFKSLELSGNTKVNVLQESVEDDVIVPYQVDECQGTTLTGTKETGSLDNLVINGRTLVNSVLEDTSNSDYVSFDQDYEGQSFNVNGTNEGAIQNITLHGQTKYIDEDGDIHDSFVQILREGNLYKGTRDFNTTYWEFGAGAKPLEPFELDPNFKQATLTSNYQHLTTPTSKQGFMFDDPNKTWTISAMFKGSQEGQTIGITLDGGRIEYEKKPVANGQWTRITWTFQGSTTLQKFRFENKSLQGEIKVAQIMVTETDYAVDWKPSSVDGEYKELRLVSCKMPVLTATGKNLFNLPLVQGSQTYGTIGGKPTHEIYSNRVTNEPNKYIKVKPNTQITFSIINNDVRFAMAELDEHGNRLGDTGWLDTVSQKTITTKSSTHYIGFNFKKVGNTDITVEEVINSNPMLEYSNTSTSYEPYKTNILSCNEEVVLRGIGDVRDELDCLTDEIVQNIGEDVYNGYANEYWFYSGTIDNSIEFARSVLGVKRILACDKLPIFGTTERFVYASNKFYVRVLKDKLTTLDVEGFNEWLSNNPITVQYELETPIIKTVDLSIVDQNNNKIDKIHVFNETTHVNASSDELTPTVNIGKSVSYPTIIKPNTKYTVDLKRNDKPLTINLGGTEVAFADGETRKTITTPSTLTNDKLSYYGIGAKCNEIMLIEGEVEENVDYFTGMQSVKVPTVSTVGKNVVNEKIWKIEAEEEGYQCLLSAGWATEAGKSGNPIIIPVHVEKGKVYTLKCKNKATKHFNDFYFMDDLLNGKVKSFRKSVGKNTTLNSFVDTIITFTADRDYKYLQIDTGNSDANGYIVKNTLQLEEGSIATPYEPYKSTILSCDEDVELCSSPNGVYKDYINIPTHKLFKTNNVVTVNGSENWTMYPLKDEYPNTVGFYYTHKNSLNSVEDGLQLLIDGGILKWFENDKFPGNLNTSEEGISLIDNKYIKASVLKSRLETVDVNGFKKWLTNNPITVQYVTNPTVKTINISIIDQDNVVQSKLHTFNDTTHIMTSSDELTPIIKCDGKLEYPVVIKPSTQYTILANTSANAHALNNIAFDLGGAKVTNTFGTRKITVTTPSTLANNSLTITGEGAKIGELMVLEGNESDTVPYFEGMSSCKMPILRTIGKNLFDGKFELGSVSMDSGQEVVLNGAVRTSYIKVKPNTTYSLSRSVDTTVGVRTYNKNKKFVKSISLDSNNSTTFTTPNEAEYIRFALIYANNDITVQAQLEEGSNTTSYEAHKSSILSYNDNVTLRGIGDVQDTLNCNTGEMTVNINEKVLNGSENWNLSYVDRVPLVELNLMNDARPKNEDTFKCDKLPIMKGIYSSNSTKGICFVNGSDGNYSLLRIRTQEIIDGQTLAEFKKWLSDNPITIQYQTKPTAKALNLSITDQDENAIPKIKSYKDVTHLEVTVPKQSLLPNVSAEVATDNSKDMSSLTTKHQEISETQSAIQDNIQSQSDEIDTALMATTEIFESILE